jgi:hypothetical protein
MGTRLRSVTFARAAALIAALPLGAVPVASGAEAYKAPRTADGKPDLDGIWQALNTANWDIQEHAARSGPVVALGAAGAVPAGLGVVEGNEIPYLPAAAAKKKENFENRLTADPEIKCYLPGVPRATYIRTMMNAPAGALARRIGHGLRSQAGSWSPPSSAPRPGP